MQYLTDYNLDSKPEFSAIFIIVKISNHNSVQSTLKKPLCNTYYIYLEF